MELLFVIFLILCKNGEMFTINNASDIIHETGIRTAKVLGEGTKVEVVVPPLLLYCLSVALALSIFGLLVVSFFAYKLSLKLQCGYKGVGAHQRFASPTTAVQEHDAGSLHYAAVNLKRSNEQQLQGDTDGACVYSRVKS